jgi:glycosyltransferase involved in cell wall biosynthesis
MKIVYLSKTSILSFAGGAELRTEKVTAELAKNGHEVIVLCGKTDPTLPSTVAENNRKIKHIKCVPDFVLNYNRVGFYLTLGLFPIFSLLPLLNEIQKDDVDIVVDLMTPHPTLAVILCKIYGVRIATVIHGFFDSSIFETYNPIISIIQLLVQNFLRIFRYDLLITPTEHIKENIIEYGVRSENIEVIPNGVEMDEYQHDIHTANRKDIVVIGRLTKTKGHDTIIKSLSKLKQSRNRVPNLHIIGGGPYKSQLHQQAIESGVSNEVIIHGYVEEDRKLELMQSALLFVYASKYESFGIVLLEAMAAGLPIIAVDNPAYHDFFENGKNGYLVSDSPTVIADKIGEFLDNPDLVQTISNNNRKKVTRDFSWAQIATDTENTLNSIK